MLSCSMLPGGARSCRGGLNDRRVPIAHAAGLWSPAASHARLATSRPASTARTAALKTNKSVKVFDDEGELGAALCAAVEAAAIKAVADHGVFYLAVPGGSVLKMLAGLTASKLIDWTAVRLAFVNHKCVPALDKSSTYKKSLGLFVEKVGLPLQNVLAPGGSADGAEEAAAYASKVEQLIKDGMKCDAAGVPRFDLMLLGMGADGHVGSLYPKRPEALQQGLVLPVRKADGPSSITLSLPVMNAAAHIIVAATGASKASTVKLAVEGPALPAGDLPAQMVEPASDNIIMWMLDSAAASQLTSFRS